MRALRPRTILGRLALAAGGLALGALLAEALARVVQPNGSSDLLFGAPDAAPVGLYVNDWDLVMRPAAGFRATCSSLGYTVPLRINALGLRGPEVAPGAQQRWLAIGDSFTMAVQVREEQSFPALVGAGTGTTFFNAGVDGYSTWQALRRYEQLDGALGTGGVLLTFFLGNDLDENVNFPRQLERVRSFPDGAPIPRETAGWLAAFLGRHSYLYAHLRVRAQVHATRAGGEREVGFRRNELHAFTTEGSGKLASLLPETTAALTALRDAARLRQDRLLVAVAPPAFVVDRRRAEDTLPLYGLAVSPEGLRAPGSAVRGVLDGLGIGACDLTEPLAAAVARGERPYFTFDGHWTVAGHRVVAAAVQACMQAAPGAPGRPGARVP